MKKNLLKKVTSLALAGALTLGLAACGGASGSAPAAGGSAPEEAASNSADFKKSKIAVCVYEDSTEFSKGMQDYFKKLGEAMNVEIVIGLYSMMDEAANIETTTQLISSGVDGIIGTTDVGTSTIIDECEAAGVYYASYLNDLNASFAMDHDHVFNNEYFLGAIADGYTSDSDALGDLYFDSLIQYNETHADAPLTHVAFTVFPAFSHPQQTASAMKFAGLVEEYNKTAETPITVDPLDENVDVLQFASLDETYFSKHADIDAIICFADGGSFVYPTMVSAGVDTSIKLFTAGFNDSLEANFGSNGTQTLQQVMGSPFEGIIYPLVLMVNKLNGVEFADQPEQAERISSSLFVANSDESMKQMMNSLYVTYDASKGLITPETIVDLTAVANPDATYAGLVEKAQSFSLDQVTVE